VTNCTFTGNFASGNGGCIDNVGIASVTNCTLIGNSALNIGGGIENYGPGAMTVTNCTLTGNSASFEESSNDGGGIDTGAVLTMNNTIVANSAIGPDVYKSGKPSSPPWIRTATSPPGTAAPSRSPAAISGPVCRRITPSWGLTTVCTPSRPRATQLALRR